LLLHIRHTENRGSVPDGLVFEFEEPSLRRRFGEMAKRVSGMGHSGKEDEAPVFIPIAKGEHVFAGLPLLSGSRFCLRMPDYSRSQLHLILSPLNSLVRNSEIPLKISSPVRDTSPHIRCKALSLGRIHVLYISPESLSSRTMREDLHTIVSKSQVSSLIIDNAYCISEWGPDFRPEYLRIPQIIKDLQMQNPDLTVIALSAVSGEMIRKDVVRVLKLRDISPNSQKNFYREQISFQVIPVEGQEDKKQAYEEFTSSNFLKFQENKDLSDPHQDISQPYHTFIEPFSDNAENLSRDFPDISVSTQGKGKEEKTHIRIDTDLGDSAEIWFLHTAQGGEYGNRFHCVRISDLPCASCETDMRTRKTRIPACSHNRCAFGKKEICDYGRQHFFIAHQYPDAADEVLCALRVLDFLITGHAAGENPLRVPLSAFPQKQAERAMFRLAVIRVIEHFSIDTREQEPVFKVYGYTGNLSAGAAHAGIMNYLRCNDISLTRRFDFHTLEEMQEKTAEIDRYQDMHGSRIRAAANASDLRNWREYEEFFLVTGRYLTPVVCHVQEELRDMAYLRLWHLKEMLKARGCRYSALLKNVQTADEDWKCARCDRCVPDLHFDMNSISRPQESFRLTELENRFSQWMKNREIPFDAVSADRLIQEFGDFYDNLLIRSRAVLEHNPRNIKAMYVLREISPDDGKSMLTEDLMQIAVLDMKPLQVIRFYETSKADTQLKQSMFDIMDNEYGTLNTPEGEQWMYREAVKLNLPSRITEMLGWRTVLNIMAKTGFSSRNTRLNQLLKEF